MGNAPLYIATVLAPGTAHLWIDRPFRGTLWFCLWAVGLASVFWAYPGIGMEQLPQFGFLVGVQAIAAADLARLLAPPVDVAAAFRKGQRLLLAGDLGAARSAFARVTRRNPEDPAGWLYLALVHRRIGEGHEARRSLERCESVDRTGVWTPEVESLRAEAERLRG